MNKITFVIPGDPLAKKRPRFTRRGHAYNEQKADEEGFGWQIKSQLPKGFAMFEKDTPVALECSFYLSIPESASKKKQREMAMQIIKHTKKPDLDNCVKYVKDCLKSIIYHDDSAVIKETSTKEYSSIPRTEIVISKVEKNKDN